MFNIHMRIFKHMRIGYVILLKCVGLLFNIYTADCDVQQWWPERLKCLSTPHCSSPNLGDNALFRAADVLVGQWIGECSKLRVHYSKPAPKLLFEQFGGPLGRSTWCNEGKPIMNHPNFWWFIPPIYGDFGTVYYCFHHIYLQAKTLTGNCTHETHHRTSTIAWGPLNNGLEDVLPAKTAKPLRRLNTF